MINSNAGYFLWSVVFFVSTFHWMDLNQSGYHGVWEFHPNADVIWWTRRESDPRSVFSYLWSCFSPEKDWSEEDRWSTLLLATSIFARRICLPRSSWYLLIEVLSFLFLLIDFHSADMLLSCFFLSISFFIENRDWFS